MNNIERYNSIFKSVLILDDSQVESASIDNVPQWDSLEHFHLISEIEKQFSIKFHNEDIAYFISYERGLEILRKLGVTI